MNKKYVIAIDFDDTITEPSPFPYMGKIRPEAKRYIRQLYMDGYLLILWTCRCDKYLEEAIEALQDEGILQYFTYINEDGLNRNANKVVADFYIDDRSYLGDKLEWEPIYKYITENLSYKEQDISMMVNYLYPNTMDKEGDLVCSITEDFDTYLVCSYQSYKYIRTYLYNDLERLENENTYRIAIRVPGATRGHIDLMRVSKNCFKIKNIEFYDNVCFGEDSYCYDKKINDYKSKYIDKILDFSNVQLRNNI